MVEVGDPKKLIDIVKHSEKEDELSQFMVDSMKGMLSEKVPEKKTSPFDEMIELEAYTVGEEPELEFVPVSEIYETSSWPKKMISSWEKLTEKQQDVLRNRRSALQGTYKKMEGATLGIGVVSGDALSVFDFPQNEDSNIIDSPAYTLGSTFTMSDLCSKMVNNESVEDILIVSEGSNGSNFYMTSKDGRSIPYLHTFNSVTSEDIRFKRYKPKASIHVPSTGWWENPEEKNPEGDFGDLDLDMIGGHIAGIGETMNKYFQGTESSLRRMMIIQGTNLIEITPENDGYTLRIGQIPKKMQMRGMTSYLEKTKKDLIENQDLSHLVM